MLAVPGGTVTMFLPTFRLTRRLIRWLFRSSPSRIRTGAHGSGER